MMDSVLIEYLRFSNLDTGVLRGGEPYILAHKNLPVKQVTTPFEQDKLLEKLTDCLRYNAEISEEEKWKTIVDISGEIRSFFIDITSFGYHDCQLDVVLNASELGLIPFELLLDDDQKPWFADPGKNISFTRRLRQDHLEDAIAWPLTPKVLFIYSHGGFQEVPFSAHLNAFDYALNKWGGKDNPKIFKMLEEPTFEELAAELKKNDDPENSKKQYTHVHFLAHGALILDKLRPYNYEFGIMFGKGNENPTPTKSVKELFESLAVKPFVVNYMICDGANFSNPQKPDKNPVQVTHKAGVPIVLGSQYPLSMNGSTAITRKLYSSLFNGDDIRKIISEIRQELFTKRQEHHDWISLVAYVRLPEGYNDYKYKVGLYCEMQNLKSARSKTDIYLDKKIADEEEFITITSSLSNSIKSLEGKLKEIENDAKYEKECLENLGQLGSAYKRLAEMYFIQDTLKHELIPQGGFEKQRNLLQKALEYYKRACDKNLSHHWSLVQYLCLDLVLNNQITDIDYWYAARKSIDVSIAENPDSWAYGSQLELLLLDPHASVENKKVIFTAIANLIRKSDDNSEGIFPLESTWYQINRYKTWWIAGNGYPINNNILLADADFIDQVLNRIATSINERK